MASSALRGTPTADTANVTSYVTASFTPVAGEQLVIFVNATGTVASAPTLTASANGLTMSRLGTTAVKNTSLDTQYVFMPLTAVPASPVPMTLTFNCSQDAATGVSILVAGVSGLSKFGPSVAIQRAVGNNIAGGSAASATLPAPASSTNPLLFCAHVGVQTGTTQPAGWTKLADVNYTTPAAGSMLMSRDSGFSGTTVSTSSTTNGACSAILIELDASAIVTSIPFVGWGVPI